MTDDFTIILIRKILELDQTHKLTDFRFDHQYITKGNLIKMSWKWIKK